MTHVSTVQIIIPWVSRFLENLDFRNVDFPKSRFAVEVDLPDSRFSEKTISRRGRLFEKDDFPEKSNF